MSEYNGLQPDTDLRDLVGDLIEIQEKDPTAFSKQLEIIADKECDINVLDQWLNNVIMRTKNHTMTASAMLLDMMNVYKLPADKIVLPTVSTRYDIGRLLAIIERRMHEHHN